ncbi:MAG: hypothetical protein AB7E80_13135 [Hyphomicrobiaceae bacterium]
MPQALLLAVAGAGLYLGARWARQQLERMAEETRRASGEQQRQAGASRSDHARDLGTLVADPATGEYRPRR